MSPLRVLMVTGTISSLKLPAFCAASALFCERDRELVLLRAGDLVLPGDVLGGVAHVIAVEGIPQAVLDHGVDQFDVAHLDAAAQILRVRRHAHGFLAAGDHDLGIAVEDAPGSRAPPCAGREPQSWLTPQAGLSTGMPAAIEAWRAGFWPCAAVRIWPMMTSETRARLDARALQRGLDGDGAEIVGRQWWRTRR